MLRASGLPLFWCSFYSSTPTRPTLTRTLRGTASGDGGWQGPRGASIFRDFSGGLGGRSISSPTTAHFRPIACSAEFRISLACLFDIPLAQSSIPATRGGPSVARCQRGAPRGRMAACKWTSDLVAK
ncbi:hypothetical protein Salat_2501700 [Sesamum alatum]|uniref:Uncharacterized protein n=1 Tax=Sesamum alatum TaxID=300844 RepID=A0AAE2CC71_9LAMI|nr:hypothetical protein Salat_2501700 [Sesamum alatum]